MTGLRITTGKPQITFPPREVVTHRIAVIARTGMGKTYAAKNLAEEFVKAKLPFVVLDPIGAWWGLRLSADGKRAGLPVTILGGEYGDIPLEPTAGGEVADFVVDQPGHYVLDLSSFDSDAAQDRFAEGFGTRLFRAKQPRSKRQPLMLFVDEADAFAPQQPFKGQERMMGAYRTLMRRGRLFGIGMIPITQRPATLNKNVLTQAEMLIVGQITGKQDRDAVDDWVRAHATEDQRGRFLKSLAGLQKGEMWFWSPSWLQVFERVRIRKAETFDSSKTPEPDEEIPEPRPLSERAKASLEKAMASTVERAKAEDPKELQRELNALKRELRSRPTETQVEEVVRTETVEVSAFGEAMVEILRGGWAEKVGDLHRLTDAGLDLVGADVPPPMGGDELRAMWLSKLPGYESSLLTALVEAYPEELTREELAERTGRSITSSAFGEAISTLVKNRLATKGPGTVRASDDLFLEVTR